MRDLMDIYEDLTFQETTNNNLKRENANIDGNTAMGTMLRYGSEGAKKFNLERLIRPEIAKAHMEGDIHIHDLDFYALTETCCQIDLIQLFDEGFNTGHGYLREPKSITSYAALACIAIQSNQNEQHGGQSIPNFDYAMAQGVHKSFQRIYRDNFCKAYSLVTGQDRETGQKIFDQVREDHPEQTFRYQDHTDLRNSLLKDIAFTNNQMLDFVETETYRELERQTDQAMEALVHNLNTMHSRAGAQIPFSSLNYGTDTSPEGRLVIRSLLKSIEAGLGHGETPIFPISIFKVKEGINYNPGEPNYDLFQMAIRVSAKRLFPNFSFLDAPFNAQYYKAGHPETEAAYMGCRTRVIGNHYDPEREITYGRGNLSFTTINLPRLGIEAKGDVQQFFEMLDAKMKLCAVQLLDRMEIQSGKQVKNYPFLMGTGIWLDSDRLDPNDSVREVLKHGTLSIGFIGLAECLKALIGKHQGESEEAQKLGLEIIRRMREFTDGKQEETGLNWSTFATPAEGLSGRFVRMDREKYGVIPGVTDRDYYTNSFHIPVYYPISAFEKIRKEAPYHNLTNGGHISYIELDGDPTQNLEAFEQIVRYMKECGIGYGSVNHPVDRDPVCGYTGIIGDVCPNCGRRAGEGVPESVLKKTRFFRTQNRGKIEYHQKDGTKA